jgi:molecular chaperone Hsp33
MRGDSDSSADDDNRDERDERDEIVRCVIADLPVRVVAALTTGVAREAARRHGAGPAGAVALGRGLTAGLLLATLTKDDERVTLQVLGDGPLGGVTIDASGAGTARAYVKHPAAGRIIEGGARASLAGAIGQSGVISVVRDVGLRENYSGATAIRSGEIDEDVERYLTDSEQVESALACDTTVGADGRVVASAGMLVQALPGSEGAIDVDVARGLFAGRALARVVTTGDPASGEALVEAVFAGRLGKVRVLDRRPVRFLCPCSRPRAGASLATLGQADLAAMILEDGKAEVICNFCRARYAFDDKELELIRRQAAGAGNPPS